MSGLDQTVRAMLLALTLGGCAVSEPDPSPDPAVYHAMSGPEIRVRMRALADELTTLVFLTRARSPEFAADDSSHRDDILASLDRIDRQARRVGGNDVVTNYSAVNDFMNGFLDDVALAREFASRKPANLVPANRLVNSCRACHASI